MAEYVEPRIRLRNWRLRNNWSFGSMAYHIGMVKTTETGWSIGNGDHLADIEEGDAAPSFALALVIEHLSNGYIRANEWGGAVQSWAMNLEYLRERTAS